MPHILFEPIPFEMEIDSFGLSECSRYIDGVTTVVVVVVVVIFIVVVVAVVLCRYIGFFFKMLTSCLLLAMSMLQAPTNFVFLRCRNRAKQCTHVIFC